ncbi:hypothetical protein QUF55_06490 [Clostridiaceae bacterium HSG29]|nr:hypothetical protein [Clostridiaceae bacterium HSG29]
MKIKNLKIVFGLLLVSILMISFIPNEVFAEGDVTAEWVKNFGGSASDYFESVIEVSDGYIAVGYSGSSDGDLTGLNKDGNDGIIVKYDTSGNIIWNKNFGGTNGNAFYSVTEVSDGYVVVGNGAIIIKYDTSGNIIWNKIFGGSNGGSSFHSVTEVFDGYLAVGYSASTDGDLTGLNKGRTDGIIVKYDTNGNIIWKKNFGGSSIDYFESVTEVSDGYIAVGHSMSSDRDLAWLNEGGSDGVIVKYDTSGNIMWNKNFGGSLDDYFESVIEVSDGYIVTGKSMSINGYLTGINNKGYHDGIIVKYDTLGNIVWNKNFGGSYVDYFNSVIEVSDGYLAVGYSQSTNGDLTGLNKGGIDGIIVKYDKSGNVIWNKNFGGSSNDFFESVIEVSYGYIVAGNSCSSNGDLAGLSNGSWDAIIVKYDTSGNVNDLIQTAIDTPTQENIDTVWQEIFLTEDETQKENLFLNFLSNDTIFEDAYNQVLLAKETEKRQDIVTAIDKVEAVSDDNPYKYSLEIDNDNLKLNFNKKVEYGDFNKLSNYYVGKAETFSTIYYVDRANYFTNLIDDEAQRAPLMTRVNVIADKMYSKVDRFALKMATKYVEYSELYNKQDLTDKATTLVNNLNDSTYKTNLINRLNSL